MVTLGEFGMNFVKLTKIGGNEDPIYINPANVISVEQYENHTSIFTLGHKPDGGGRSISVTEKAADVVSRFQL